MGVILVDGTGVAGGVKVDTNALRVVLYDAFGNPILPTGGQAITPSTQEGFPNIGADYKVARLTRSSPDGTLRAGDDAMVFYDSIEGAAVDTNKWIQTTTTMTITQATSTGTLYNSASSVAATVGAMQASQRRFAFIGRGAVAYRTKQRHTAHFNNNLIEFGLANPPAAATTVAVPDGAFWRKDGSGQYIPVISINGSEVLGTPISNATFLALVPATDYAIFSVFLEESRATFRIMTQTGVLVTGSDQVIDFAATIGTFTVSHLQAYQRTYNNAATGTAVQVFVGQTSVWFTDMYVAPWQDIQAGLGYGSLTSPTAFTQLSNYANSAAPASATLSNTAAGYTTLGGQWQFAAVAGAETDYALFGFTNPAPYAFIVTNITINAFNTVVAVATTSTVMQWGLGFNSSAVSLATGAPYPPMRKTIGVQTFAVAAVVGAAAVPVVWTGREVVQPGRFFHVILKMPIATATATEIFRGTCAVEGYFE